MGWFDKLTTSWFDKLTTGGFETTTKKIKAPPERGRFDKLTTNWGLNKKKGDKEVRRYGDKN